MTICDNANLKHPKGTFIPQQCHNNEARWYVMGDRARLLLCEDCFIDAVSWATDRDDPAIEIGFILKTYGVEASVAQTIARFAVAMSGYAKSNVPGLVRRGLALAISKFTIDMIRYLDSRRSNAGQVRVDYP